MSSSITAFSLSVIFLASMLHLSLSWPADSITDFTSRSKRSVPVDVENPEDVVRVLVKLAQDIMDSDSIVHEKRGIDLGLSRGFSGSQAAKHLMGLAAANFANGPGRKRRDVMEH